MSQEKVQLYTDSRERRKWDNLSEFYAIIVTTEHLENARIKNAVSRDEVPRVDRRTGPTGGVSRAHKYQVVRSPHRLNAGLPDECSPSSVGSCLEVSFATIELDPLDRTYKTSYLPGATTLFASFLGSISPLAALILIPHCCSISRHDMLSLSMCSVCSGVFRVDIPIQGC